MIDSSRLTNYKVSPVFQRASCTTCFSLGTMEYDSPDNMILMSNPPMYRHVCTNCGAIEMFNEVYPKLIYLSVGEDLHD